MFATPELAARIDRAEARLCAEFAEVAARARPDWRVVIEPLAGGLAVYSGPGAPMNKLIGLGLGDVLEESALASVERQWAAREEAVRVELSTLDDGAVARLLTSRGYQLLGFENVLGRALSEADVGLPPVSGLRIHQLPPDDMELWMDVTVEGFSHADAGPLPTENPPHEALKAIFGDMAGIGGFQRYLATINSVAVAAASMRIDGSLAQLTGAATLPDFRRRGLQTALTLHRLAAARSAGCDLAVVTTAPGSKSQENAQRRGFELLYSRAVLVK